MRLPDVLQGSSSSRLLSVVVAIVFLLLCSSALYLPRYLNFNPDEARIVIDVDNMGTGWFAEHPLRTGTHFGSELQYYLLPRIAPVTVRTLRLVAAVFFVLTLAYVIWLSRAYRLFGEGGLLLVLLLGGMNGSLNYYGLWGVFDYSERIFESVFLLHVLLFLHQRHLILTKRATALVLSSLCLFTIAYPALVLPSVVLLIVALLFREATPARNTRDWLKDAFARGLPLLIPVVLVGLISLKYASHPEFLHPRRDIQHLFFPLSNYPKTLAGLLGFLSSGTMAFLETTFSTIAPLPGSSGASVILTLGVILAFIVGLIRSLFERTRNPVRFVIAVYVLLVLACLVGLAVVGVYAFGDIRYALFLHVPLLLVATYGLVDVISWIAKPLVPSSLSGTGQRVASAFFVGVALLVSVGSAYRVIGEKSHFNAEFAKLAETIEADRSPLLFYDTFAEWNLRVLGMDQLPNRHRFLLDFLTPPKPREEFRTFVASGEDLLWVTYHLPSNTALFGPYLAELEQTHFKASDLSIDMWRVTSWKSWNSTHAHLALPLLLDIGDSTARQWMRTGWHADEVSGVETFAWSKGDHSVLTLPLPAAGDIRMEFSALPFVFPDSPPQRVTIVLNGTVVQQVQLQPGLQRYSVNLPAAALRQSLDTLEFRYAYTRVPRQVLSNSVDERELAVAWSSISFAPLEHTGDGEPVVRSADRGD